jgi:lipopolysaccharide export system permease protein
LTGREGLALRGRRERRGGGRVPRPAHPALDADGRADPRQFRAPYTVPIYELPGFIAQLNAAGFAALQHRIWLQMQLSNPLMLSAMVLIGAGFTMRHTRFGRTGMMVLAAILLGFGVYFIRDFAEVLGESGQLPAALVAWAPPVAAILLAVGVLLHTEDG